MLDWKKVKKLLNREKIGSPAIINCLRIAINMLKSDETIITIVKKNLVEEYAEKVVDIWKPYPNTKQRKTKNKIKKILPKALRVLSKNLASLKADTNKIPKINYDSVKPHFENWDKTYAKAEKKMRTKSLSYSNPYLTTSVGNSFRDGKKFQVSAKLASSIEGSWGSSIENILPIFNSKLIEVRAARFDYILGGTAYDVKSGPRVYNLGQVEEARAKRDRIRSIAQSPKFKDMVKVKDFKVAVIYGREGLADVMSDSKGLIIFGKDSWKELTGDEWNAYKLFLWVVKYKIKSPGSKWTEEDLKQAVEHFTRSFYGEDDTKLESALQDSEYQAISKLVN